MSSPAQRHRQAKLAAQAVNRGSAEGVAPDRHEEGAEATEYQLLLAAMGEDMRRLHDIQSTEGKIEAKRHLIEKFTPHVDATLEAAAESGKAVQDEILVTMMLWRLDIGDFQRGLDIAEHVLRFGLRLPERFQRSAGCLVAEEVAEAALAADRQDAAFDVQVLQRAAQLTAGCDMPDVVRAKLHKATGLHLIGMAEADEAKGESAAAGAPYHARAQALDHLRRAIALHDKIGVKKEIERLSAWLEKHRPPAGQNEDEQV